MQAKKSRSAKALHLATVARNRSHLVATTSKRPCSPPPSTVHGALDGQSKRWPYPTVPPPPHLHDCREAEVVPVLYQCKAASSPKGRSAAATLRLGAVKRPGTKS